MPFILILALIAAGGGISYKAESAVPGDVLYVVKTHVDEPIRSFIALTPSARISVAENQAAARLSEAEQLSSIGLLDTSTKSSLDAAFKVKSSEAISGIQQLAASGNPVAAYEKATAFRTILEQHHVALNDAYEAQTDSASLASDMNASLAVVLGQAESMQSNATELAQANGINLAASNAIGAPEAGGPVSGQAAPGFSGDESTSTNEATTSSDSFGSAILTLLSKVI